MFLIDEQLFGQITFCAVILSFLIGIAVSLHLHGNLKSTTWIATTISTMVPLLMLLYNLGITVFATDGEGSLQFAFTDSAILAAAICNALLASFRDLNANISA